MTTYHKRDVATYHPTWINSSSLSARKYLKEVAAPDNILPNIMVGFSKPQRFSKKLENQIFNNNSLQVFEKERLRKCHSHKIYISRICGNLNSRLEIISLAAHIGTGKSVGAGL